jgi:hypothetical protein
MHRESGIVTRKPGKHFCGHKKDTGPKIRPPKQPPEEPATWDVRVCRAFGNAERLAELRAEQDEMLRRVSE